MLTREEKERVIEVLLKLAESETCMAVDRLEACRLLLSENSD